MRTQVNIKKRPPMELRPDLLPGCGAGHRSAGGTSSLRATLGQALCWALAFGARSLPLRFSVNGRAGRGFSRLAFERGLCCAFFLGGVYELQLRSLEGFFLLQIDLNLVWYYMIAGAVYLLAGRRSLRRDSAGLFVLIGLMNRYVIRFRAAPSFPGDLLTLRTAANVAGNYDYWPDEVQLRCLLALALFCLLLWKLPATRDGGFPGCGWCYFPLRRPARSICASFSAPGF